ncbi:LacI family DNA-binding transcriptional regulator [Planctomonas psychrotolerans]|uniref:LacI family DNA-binding transcriptional regulator n=1 Tax=Planctomonas psychrotolerans TaxID=2528712 RepID=UPI00123B6D22|nr:LacI family DNA-binding transcriptional regulator [Planctomonas psychrotolerans]
MARRATVYDVAQRAGVSIATVSFAFTRPEKVKPETIRTVMVAADELGYVPSANARGLARGRTGAIGLYAYDYVLDPPADEHAAEGYERSARLFPLYADEVQRGVQLECRSRGLALMIGGNRTPAHLPHVIEVAGRVDALIAFAGALSVPHLEQAAARMPVVELGGEVRVAGAHTVLVDNRQGMADLTAHLVRVHRYERFAYLGELGTPEFRARREGFESTLEEAGVPVPPVLPAHPGDDATTSASVAALLREGPLPQVLVCDTDQAAVVAIDALRRAGLSVPGDVAVTGFDGIIAGRLLQPILTTVRQPMAAIGRAAVRLLADALDGAEQPTTNEDLVATFSAGGTCGCD